MVHYIPKWDLEVIWSKYSNSTEILNLEKKDTLSVSTKSYEYNYYIGDEVINKIRDSKDNKLIYPIKNGIDWDLMEKDFL